MDKYKTIFIDSSSYKKSSMNPVINGDDLARGIEATFNDMDAMGYELNRTIDYRDLGNSAHMEGMILLFQKIEKPS